MKFTTIKSLFLVLICTLTLSACDSTMFVGGYGSSLGGGVMLSGNSMFTGSSSRFSITTDKNLPAYFSTSTTMTVKTDSLTLATQRLYMTIFAEIDDQNYVQKHAHVLVANLSPSSKWEYQFESNERKNEAYLKQVKLNGSNWMEHLLYEDAATDWFSTLWQINDFYTPDTWIGKRWSTTYGHKRIIMEYREALPKCIEIGTTTRNAMFTHGALNPKDEACDKLYQEFAARADKAFAIEYGASKIIKDPEVLPNFFKPDKILDTLHYIGNVRSKHFIPTSGGNSWL